MERYIIPLLIISAGTGIQFLLSWLFSRNDKPRFDPFDQDV
jgi:hypothetical protein